MRDVHREFGEGGEWWRDYNPLIHRQYWAFVGSAAAMWIISLSMLWLLVG